MFAVTEARQDISFEAMTAHQQAGRRRSSAGSRTSRRSSRRSAPAGIGAANQGRMFIRLKPRDQRGRSATGHRSELRARSSPTCRASGSSCSSCRPIRIGGQLSEEPVSVHAPGHGPERALPTGRTTVESSCGELPGFAGRDQRPAAPEPAGARRHRPRQGGRRSASRADQIEHALYSAFGTRQVSTIYTPTNEYAVIIEVDRRWQRDPAALSLLYVQLDDGRARPARRRRDASTQPVGPLTVNHVGQLPAVTLSFNLGAGVVARRRRRARSRRPSASSSLPATVIDRASRARPRRSRRRSGGLGLLLAGGGPRHLHRARHPLRELHPPAHDPLGPAVGRASARCSRCCSSGRSSTCIAFIGIIMLIGIVKKNAIMMIDFALAAAARATGRRRCDAITEACLLRFRPIMMTTMAALMGTLPIALGVRRRRRAAPPARPRRRRRPARLAAADALHHAGHLYLLRARPRRVRPLARPRAASRASTGRGADPAARRLAAHPAIRRAS